MQLLAGEEYGLRCLLQVASGEGDRPVPISRVAEAEGISPEYAAKLMRKLRLAGLVESSRGAEGGYRLARPGREITVYQALRALGEDFFDERFCACHAGLRASCARSSDCALRAVWRAVQTSVREALEKITLTDLKRDERSMSIWLEGSGIPVEEALAEHFGA